MSSIISLIFLLGSWSWGHSVSQERSDILATVNGEEICRDEFNRFLGKYAARLQNQREKNVNEALENAIEVKLEQLLAVKHGVLKDPGYDIFRKDLKDENARRKEAKKKNEIFYGPTEFSEGAYYDYRQSKLRIELKKIIFPASRSVDEVRIRNSYDSMRDSFFKKQDLVQILKVELPSSNPKIIAEVEKQIGFYQDPGSLEARYGCRASIESFDDRFFREQSEEGSKYTDLVSRLKVEEAARYEASPDTIYIIKCLKRMPGGFRDLDEVRDIVIDRLIEEEYGAMLREMRGKSKIEINKGAVEKIVNESLNGNAN